MSDSPTFAGAEQLQANTFPIRKECPPGACDCRREELLADPAADTRILLLTREEEKKLLARLENISSHGDLKKIGLRLREQLGIALHIMPGDNEVRTVRGLRIQIDNFPGLCRKTRQTIPAAVRRCLEQHQEIVFAILNEHDLLGGG